MPSRSSHYRLIGVPTTRSCRRRCINSQPLRRTCFRRIRERRRCASILFERSCMSKNRSPVICFALKRILPVVAGLGAAGVASAQEAPRSFVASPTIFHVARQSDKCFVVEVAWKPGERDKFHSHPAAGTYFLTPCQLRWYYSDGRTRDINVPAGTWFTQKPVASHSIQNMSYSECKLVIFEPK